MEKILLELSFNTMRFELHIYFHSFRQRQKRRQADILTKLWPKLNLLIELQNLLIDHISNYIVNINLTLQTLKLRVNFLFSFFFTLHKQLVPKPIVMHYLLNIEYV